MGAVMTEPREDGHGNSCPFMVNATSTTFLRSPATSFGYMTRMDQLFIPDRLALSDADDLMTHFGEDAANEAAARAKRSRNDGNVQRFCHWRQIERVIAALADEGVTGTVH